MSAKFRAPVLRAVRTPEALSALRRWLDLLPGRVRERGEEYYRGGRVEAVRSGADHFCEARVRGGERYAVTLFFTRGSWSSTCTCPVGADCKHAYAAGVAWLAQVASGEPDGADPALAAAAAARRAEDVAARTAAPARSPEPAPPEEGSFRRQWAPVLEAKLGRPLTAAEGDQLESLAALFAEFQLANGRLYPGALLRHGFDYTAPRGAPLYAPAYVGWWDDATAPADPWALWQFIAYDYELSARPIPELFQPLTHTAALRAIIAARVAEHELAAWQRALAAAEASVSSGAIAPAAAAIDGIRARIRPDGLVVVELRAAANQPWKLATQTVLAALGSTRPADFEHLPPPEAALANALAAEARGGLAAGLKNPLPPDVVATLFRTRAATDAWVQGDGQALTIEPDPLLLAAAVSAADPEQLELGLKTPDGRDAAVAKLITLRPVPLYVFDQRVWRGPPPLPAKPLPLAALDDSRLMTRLRAAGLRLPPELEKNVRRVVLQPLLRCWLAPAPGDDEAMVFHAQLLARGEAPPCEQHWVKGGWQWTAQGAPPRRGPADPRLEFDLVAAQAVAARFPAFQLEWHAWEDDWSRPVPSTFPDEFTAWRATLPAGVKLEASAGLASLLGPPLHARLDVAAVPAETAGRDWFNLSVRLRVADVKLTPEELALLLRARGKWVSLPGRGWQRLEVDAADGDGRDAAAALERLGLDADDVVAGGRPALHRVHALQLAAEADWLEQRDVQLARVLRERTRALAGAPPPPIPAGLHGTLRPYQEEGFRFLAHLSHLGLGGVLADDMGLGKTVQTLAWLLHLRDTASERLTESSAPAAPLVGTPLRGVRDNPSRAPHADGEINASGKPATSRPFRALVVCPKSVVHGWLAETARFAPGLSVVAFNPLRRGREAEAQAGDMLVANYSQLRLNAAWFRSQAWDAVVLDEGQFIKNPGSQVAAAARALVAAHRVVLTGTPIENRLSDLWSLFAFAQPGLLGTQPAFRRHYTEDNPAALARLHRRIQHFLLRRTKSQAAPELPSRTEDDLIIELEEPQRRLYDAELKRARAQLLGIETNDALAAVRFNVLASLLRLRQICCHPGLVDPAHRDLPSAKLEALMERLEELRDEGNQVLVFSQFVEMLEIIRGRLSAAGIGHLMLTGRTENRGELVEEFQRDRSKTVFLLSLKAAGFGLNLTAASYAILYDPWWNPAAEAQAIDRTHRIGQTQPVVAYRLLAEATVEEKIRALQRDKAALAAAVVQEDSLARVLDLESLRQILA